MNELNLYALFEAVLKKSKVIEGRFHVAEEFGSELNTNALDKYITDMLGNLTTPNKKFPLAMQLPPLEIVNPDTSPGWSRFKCRVFFLTPKNSNKGTKSLNQSTNTSGHTTMQDWKDMRECAGDFYAAVEKVLMIKKLLNKMRPIDKAGIVYERYTTLGNDKASGVQISFDMEIYMPCEMADYNDSDLEAVQINEQNIHPLHKH